MKSVIGYRLSVIAKELSLSLLSAVLLILSFPKFNLEPLAWFGFVPLFFGLKNKSKRRVFSLSYFTGLIFWSGIIYWLIHVTLPGTIVLILYLALYFGIFGLIVSTINYELSATNLLFIPSLWVLLEYIRGHLFTGFPWTVLGHSQYLNLPVIQIADITGAWGVSFLVMMVNVAIYSVIGYRLSVIGAKRRSPVLILLCILITLTYGYYKIHRTPNTEHRTPLKISVIQGNIPQELKWHPDSKDYIVNKYLNISRQVLKDRPDLIIWPEAALPVVLEEEPIFFKRVQDFTQEIKAPLLLGAVTKRNELYYNSALLLSQEGALLNRYDKLHLVPFGEYIPLKKILPFLETVVPIGDITPGKEYSIFKIPNSATKIGGLANHFGENFAVLICFEDLFPELSREFIKRGADFLVNITNDAWYKKTAASYQHFQASVFRAVENRVFLVRTANTGVSGFIEPSGKIISLVQDEFGRNIFIDGYRTQEIKIPKRGLSFYTRYGDVFIAVCFLFVLYDTIRPFLKKR